MEEEKKNYNGWIGIVLMIVIAFFWSQNSNLKKQVQELEANYEDSEYEVRGLEDKLEQANDSIINAKSFEGGSYEDLESALNDLEEVE